jgi:hypothetical protein
LITTDSVPVVLDPVPPVPGVVPDVELELVSVAAVGVLTVDSPHAMARATRTIGSNQRRR